ncbi:MAG: hypothetical protein ACM3H8_00595 [Sphingobacteriales bacterium]
MKIFIILLFLFPGIVFSQQQERKVIIYNIGFGGLTSGIGALINKKKEENWKRSFVRGFWQGATGGLLNYSAKKSIYLVDRHKNFAYAIPARLLNAAGNSMIQNAALNEPFLKNWNLEYGIFRFDFSIHSKNKFKVRILPVAVIGSAISMRSGRFDLNTTLLTGIMSFKSKGMINTLNGQHDGINYGRAFIYMERPEKYHIISHEIIHEYQYREYLVFNSYMKPVASKMKESGFKKLFTKYIYPDIPYFALFYMIEGSEQGPLIFRNYFEFEAERFATNKDVPIK